MSIQKPKMILFDYGHTLLYEIGHNAEKGNKAIYLKYGCGITDVMV